MKFNLTARLAAPLVLVGSVVLVVFGGLMAIDARLAAVYGWKRS